MAAGAERHPAGLHRARRRLLRDPAVARTVLPLQVCWFGEGSPARSGVCSSCVERPQDAAGQVLIHVPGSREELRVGTAALCLRSLSSSMTQCLLLACGEDKSQLAQLMRGEHSHTELDLEEMLPQ